MRKIEEPDVHALFLEDLCKTLSDFRDLGHYVVLGMDTNDDVGMVLCQLLLMQLVLVKL